MQRVARKCLLSTAVAAKKRTNDEIMADFFKVLKESNSGLKPPAIENDTAGALTDLVKD